MLPTASGVFQHQLTGWSWIVSRCQCNQATVPTSVCDLISLGLLGKSLGIYEQTSIVYQTQDWECLPWAFGSFSRTFPRFVATCPSDITTNVFEESVDRRFSLFIKWLPRLNMATEVTCICIPGSHSLIFVSRVNNPLWGNRCVSRVDDAHHLCSKWKGPLPQYNTIIQ